MKKHHYLRLGVVIAIILGAVALVLTLRTKAASLDNNASDQGACNQQCETVANQMLDSCKNLKGVAATDCQKQANDAKALCRSQCTANGSCVPNVPCDGNGECAGGTCVENLDPNIHSKTVCTCDGNGNGGGKDGGNGGGKVSCDCYNAGVDLNCIIVPGDGKCSCNPDGTPGGGETDCGTTNGGGGSDGWECTALNPCGIYGDQPSCNAHADDLGCRRRGMLTMEGIVYKCQGAISICNYTDKDSCIANPGCGRSKVDTTSGGGKTGGGKTCPINDGTCGDAILERCLIGQVSSCQNGSRSCVTCN